VEDLLPREERIRWIVERSALLVDGGCEPVSGLVLPTGGFFPDHFDRSEKAVKLLLKRVVKLAGLSDLGIKGNVVKVDEDAGGGGGCSTGACGVGGGAQARVERVEKRKNGWTVNVGAGEVSNPTVLTTGLVRAVSHIFIREFEINQDLERGDADSATDLGGVLFGMGTLLCNGSYIYSKG
jgi:hypothetical protein